MATKKSTYLSLVALGVILLAVGLSRAALDRRKVYVPPSLTGSIVTFPSGSITLHGVIYKPAGAGPFPAILYNHGSAPGMYNNEAFEALGPLFANRGWVLFAPYRRGQGLSAGAGPYIVDDMSTAGRKGGTSAYIATMIRLLETDHLNDQLAALAWLRKQPFVQPNRIAVAGNSFGGIETVLGAERESYGAGIDASGAAEVWAQSPEMRARLIRAVRNSHAPIFFFQPENDYDVSPRRILGAEMREAGKISEIKIYPSFGKSAADGHSFSYRGSSVWAGDAFRFLEQHCGK